MASSKKFKATVDTDSRRRVVVPIPFDPSKTWTPKPRHHVGGTINEMTFRGVIEPDGDRFVMALGPAWRRDCGIGPGDHVEITVTPEGPQRADLAPDIAKALDAEPKAAEFFDSIAQFYRKGYLRWIDSTKRSPELRAERIAEMVKLLKAGKKERPS